MIRRRRLSVTCGRLHLQIQTLSLIWPATLHDLGFEAIVVSKLRRTSETHMMEIGTMRGLSGILRNNFALVLIFLHSFGCSGCRSGWDTKDYRSAVRSGRSVIAPAIEMEKQFSNTEHMLIMYGGTGSNKHEWQTVSFFGVKIREKFFQFISFVVILPRTIRRVSNYLIVNSTKV